MECIGFTTSVILYDVLVFVPVNKFPIIEHFTPIQIFTYTRNNLLVDHIAMFEGVIFWFP